MRRILGIAWKDLLVRFASPTELLFFIVLPVIFAFIVSGFASSQGGGGDNRIVVLVVNQDGGALSSELVQTLEGSKSVRPEVLDATEAARALRRRRRAGPAHHPGRLRGQPAGRPAGGSGLATRADQRQRPGRPAGHPGRRGPGQPGPVGGQRQRAGGRAGAPLCQRGRARRLLRRQPGGCPGAVRQRAAAPGGRGSRRRTSRSSTTARCRARPARCWSGCSSPCWARPA